MSDGKNKESGSFLGFVLLDKPAIDLDLLKKDLEDDWNISIDDKDMKAEQNSLVATIGEMMITVSMIEAPVPNDEAVENAKTNQIWKDAVTVAKEHKAQFLVAVLGGQNSPLDAATLYVKISSSALKQPNATGIYTSGTVHHPGVYMDLAKSYISNGNIPILNLIYLGFYSNDNGQTVSAYTFGLKTFDKNEIEVINSSHTRDELFEFFHNIIFYILENDVELKDGETIGFTEDQKLPITLSKSDILEFETLKIGY